MSENRLTVRQITSVLALALLIVVLVSLVVAQPARRPEPDCATWQLYGSAGAFEDQPR